MKFAIISKGDKVSKELQKKLLDYLVSFEVKEDKENPDIVISVGGDGTLLQAFHQYSHMLETTSFVGIHTGHLGFYADYLPKDLEKLVISIARGPMNIVSYPLLNITITDNEDNQESFLALNECTVKSIEGTLVVDVELGDEPFETFRGDGLCLSTPSGSTAYNKALGGALLHPSIKAFQIAEMASINNRVFRTIGSPLILPSHHKCVLKPISKMNYKITVDHHSLDYTSVKSISFSVAEQSVRFARFRQFPFWCRVRDSFITDK